MGNSFRVGRKILILVLLQLILCFSMLLFQNIVFATLISCIIFLMNIYEIKYSKNTIVSLAIIFLMLSFILHFGNLVSVNLLGYQNDYLNLDKHYTINAIIFANLCHIAFSAAVSMQPNRVNRYESKKRDKYILDSKTFWRVAIVATLAGVIPKIYIDITQIRNQALLGYEESLSLVTQYGVTSILAQFFYVGVLMLIFSLKGKKRTARCIILIFSALEAFSMLSGGRIYAIAFIISMIYVYYIRVDTLKTKHVVLGIIIIYVLSSVLNGIAEIRTLGSFGFEDLLRVITDSLGKDNPILKILVEMGSTMKTVIVAFEDIPSYMPYGLGTSYVETVLSIIPESDGILTDMNHLIYIYNFRNFHWLGGSWIGEAYYNFSWFGFLFCYIWGKIIGKFESYFLEAEDNNNYLAATICISFIYYIVVYVRDYFARFATAIQVAAVIVVLGWILRSVFYKRS